MRQMTDPAAAGDQRTVYPFLIQFYVVASQAEFLQGQDKGVGAPVMARIALLRSVGPVLTCLSL